MDITNNIMDDNMDFEKLIDEVQCYSGIWNTSDLISGSSYT